MYYTERARHVVKTRGGPEQAGRFQNKVDCCLVIDDKSLQVGQGLSRITCLPCSHFPHLLPRLGSSLLRSRPSSSPFRVPVLSDGERRRCPAHQGLSQEAGLLHQRWQERRENNPTSVRAPIFIFGAL